MKQSPVIVAGMGPLGVAIAEALATHGLPVTVLCECNEIAMSGARLEQAGVVVVEGAAPWVFQLEQFDLPNARGLVLCADDDNVNLDAAIAARAMAPALPLMARLSDTMLQTFVAETVANVEVFSLASIAAPATASLALHRMNPPVDGIVAVVAMIRQLLRGVTPRPSALFWSVFAAFVAMLIPTSWFFARSLHLTFFDATYFVWTTALAVGYGDIALRDASTLAKAVGMTVMLLGAGFTAAMVGLMADWLLTRRLGSLFVRVSVRMTNHIVVVGAGSFGARVAELLHGRGNNVVVIEAAADAPNVQRLRALHIPVVIGDATLDDTLDLASAWSASILLAMTNHDAVNLHLGLRMQKEMQKVPVIARLRSRQVTRHVDEHCDFSAISPLLTATEHVVERVLQLVEPNATAPAGDDRQETAP